MHTQMYILFILAENVVFFWKDSKMVRDSDKTTKVQLTQLNLLISSFFAWVGTQCQSHTIDRHGCLMEMLHLFEK